MTFDQIEQLWIANGGAPGWAPFMAGVAIAESGGNPGALNNDASTGDYSVGLWQINYFDGLLGPRTQEYGSPSALQSDPNKQAKAAISLFANGAGASNWKTDAAYRAWQAAGFPNQPSAATVQKWGLGPNSLSGLSTLASENQTANGAQSPCLLNLPIVGCVFTRSNAKALLGGAAVASGVLAMALGAVVVVAFGLAGSRAGGAARSALRRLPGPGGAVAAATSSSDASEGATEPADARRSEYTPAAHEAAGAHAPGRGGRGRSRSGRPEAEEDRQERAAVRQERRNEDLRAGRRPVKGQRSYAA